MPRQTQRRLGGKTTVSNVNLSPTPAPSLQPQRRSFTPRGNDQGIRTARALERALGVGTEFGISVRDKRAEKANLAGTLAALEGRELTPEELSSDSFMLGLQRVNDKATSADLQAEALEWYNTTDTSNMSNDEILAGIREAVFEPSLSGLDVENDLDKQSILNLLPSIAGIEETILKAHQDDTATRVEQDADASLDRAFSAGEYTRGDGTLALEELNIDFFALYSNDANSKLFQLISGKAISEGKPELLEQLKNQKAWASGAPAPSSIRSFDTKFANSLNQANARKAQLEAKDDIESKSAQKQLLDDMSAALFLNSVSGKPIVNGLREAVDAGLSDESARAIFNFDRNLRNAPSNGAVDFDALAQLQNDSFAPDFNTQDAMARIGELASAGRLGTPEQQLVIVQREVDRINKLEVARRTDPQFTAERAELAEQYRVSSLSMNIDPRFKKQMVKADSLLLELVVVQGMSAEAAAEKVLIDVPVLGTDGANKFATVIQSFVSGKLPVSSLLNFMPQGATLEQYVNELSQAGLTLNREQRDDISAALREKLQGTK